MAIKFLVNKKALKISLIVLVILTAIIIYASIHLNRLLTNALHKGFDQSVFSEVYTFNFENLQVDIFAGSLKVSDFEMLPKVEEIKSFPEINSSFKLGAKKLIMKNVKLFRLLVHNKLHLRQIELIEPGIDFTISDMKPVFIPFTKGDPNKKTNSVTSAIESYTLDQFKMTDAHFIVANSARKREFNIQRINLSLKDVQINRHPGRDVVTYRNFSFSIGEMEGKLDDKLLRYIHFKDFTVTIDSLQMEDTQDTLIYQFANVTTGIKNLDLQTADSIYHVTMESFNLNYRKKSIEFKNLTFKPNLSNAAMQARYKYRKEHFSGKIGTITLAGLEFDSLIHHRKIFIKEIGLDEVFLSIYKDLTKPFPPNHRPEYLGQQIKAISIPVNIRHLRATNFNLENREVTPDGRLGKANIQLVNLHVENITNLDSNGTLAIDADAYVENKAHAQLQIGFLYSQPKFNFKGKIDKFDMTDLNGITNSYAPALVKSGIADAITFSGTVYHTYSKGTMQFLYHDLSVDFDLEDKAKWKSNVLGLAANTYLNNTNPPSPKLPPREVEFYVERDMRKGYLSMLIKSVLDGVKETFIMDKKNRKAYKEVKKEAKQDLKKKNKEEQKK